MNPPNSIKHLFSKKCISMALFALVWSMLLFLWALPTLNRIYENRKNITTTSARLSWLSEMSAAGLWFEAAAQSWEPTLREKYDRLFPMEKRREELFLELARVAGESNINPFTLREIPIRYYNEDTSGDELTEDHGNEYITMMVEASAVDSSDLPGAELHNYRLLAEFSADYYQITRFLAGLESIPRALTLHSLSMEAAPKGIDVEMELDFYVQVSE
jgi:hypothetical protein